MPPYSKLIFSQESGVAPFCEYTNHFPLQYQSILQLLTCDSYIRRISAIIIYFNMQSRETRLKNEKELIQEAFENDDMGDITKLQPIGNSLNQWFLQFKGRKGTDLYPGVYEVDMRIPDTYPANFPDCKFRHNFQHYHIYQSGAICLPLLKTGGWNASKTLMELSKTIVNMVHSDPVLHDHADNSMKDLYASDNGVSYRKHLQNQAKRMQNIGKK